MPGRGTCRLRKAWTIGPTSAQAPGAGLPIHFSVNVSSAQSAGRCAGFLFIASGVAALLNVVMSSSAFADPALVAVLSVTSCAVGTIMQFVPWARLPARSTLVVVVPIAFALITIGNRWGRGSDFIYAPYFFVVFIWIGVFHRPNTAIWLGPLATGAYLAPLLARPDHTRLDVTSVIVVIPVAVAAAEIISRAISGLAHTTRRLESTIDELGIARSESQERADLLAAVARAARLLNSLEPRQVLRAAVDSTRDLGFDFAFISPADPDSSGRHQLYSWGLDPEADLPEPAREVIDRCGEARSAVACTDAEAELHADATISDDRSAVGSRIISGGATSAVFVGGIAGGLSAEQIESFELISAQAGWAMNNAERFEDERRTRRIMTDASLRDELTGVGNRRLAESLLASLKDRDALLLIDLDHFKDVNDTDGHLVGDEVLVQLGRFLREHLRSGDWAARYGGEEFLVVLAGIDLDAMATAERLQAAWRATNPRTTLSIGVAVHNSLADPRATLEEADRALYGAKRAGRDLVMFGRVPSRS